MKQSRAVPISALRFSGRPGRCRIAVVGRSEGHMSEEVSRETLDGLDDELLRVSRELGVSLDHLQADKLVRHFRAVLKANVEFNLISVASADEGQMRHVVDSLAVIPLLPSSAGPVADLGSGAGFPGIPLSLVLGCDVTLVESRRKRADFLRRTVDELGLERVQVFAGRAEELAQHSPAMFGLVTARALAALPALVELAAPLLSGGGVLAAMKGEPAESEIERGARTAELCSMEFVGLERYRLPGIDARRSLALFRRTGEPLQRELPRRVGMAQRRPLA